MKSKFVIYGSLLIILGTVAIISLGSFTEQNQHPQYLSLTADMYSTGFEVHLINEAGILERIELGGAAVRKNKLEWKKFIWKKVSEINNKGYKLVLGGFETSPESNLPTCSFVFEKI